MQISQPVYPIPAEVKQCAETHKLGAFRLHDMGPYFLHPTPQQIKHNQHVYIYERGMIIREKNAVELQAWRWDGVQAVWRSAMPGTRPRMLRATPAPMTYTLQREDGYKYIHNSALFRNDLAGAYFYEEIAHVLLRRKVEAYNQGKILPFGPFALSSSGIGYETKVLPWPQLATTTLEDGYLIIKSTQDFYTWARVSAASIPNLTVLLYLIDYIVQPVGM